MSQNHCSESSGSIREPQRSQVPTEWLVGLAADEQAELVETLDDLPLGLVLCQPGELARSGRPSCRRDRSR